MSMRYKKYLTTSLNLFFLTSDINHLYFLLFTRYSYESIGGEYWILIREHWWILYSPNEQLINIFVVFF